MIWFNWFTLSFHSNIHPNPPNLSNALHKHLRQPNYQKMVLAEKDSTVQAA